MMNTSGINVFDIFVALVLLASGVFAFRRGLVKEITSLGTWILASLFSFAFFPLAQPLMQQQIENKMVADAATALGLFSGAVIILVPLGTYLTGLVASPALSSIDRSLGFVFGLVRGFLIVCLIFLGLSFAWPEDKEEEQPKWLANAKTKPALVYGVKLIKALTPENPKEQTDEILENSRKSAQKAADEAAQRLEDISTPTPYNYDKDKNEPSTYEDDLRGTMDNLIDGNSTE